MKLSQLNKPRTKPTPVLRDHDYKKPFRYGTAVAMMAVAFLLGTNKFFFDLSPLSLSFLASVGSPYLLFTAAASAVGYLFLGDVLLITKYVTGTLIVLTIRWVFNSLLKAKNEKAVGGISVAIAVTVCNLASHIGTGLTLYKVGLMVFEVAFSLLLVTSFSQSLLFLKQLSVAKTKFNLNAKFVTGTMLLLATTLLAVDNLLPFDFSITVLVLSFVVLILSFIGGDGYGAMAGVTSGLAVAFFVPSASFLGLGLAFGGMLAGTFRNLGKIGCFFSFLLAHLVMLIPNVTGGGATALLEPLLGATVFLLIPMEWLQTLPTPENKERFRSDNFEDILQGRIGMMSNSLKSISRKMQTYNAKTNIINIGDISSVFTMTMEQVCAHCRNKGYCSTAGYNNLYDAFNKMSKKLTDNQQVTLLDVPPGFKKICTTPGRMVEAINNNYTVFLELKNQNKKIDTVKENVVEQFSYIGDVLQQMGEELSYIDYLDENIGHKLQRQLENANLAVKNINVIVDHDNRVTVQLILSQLSLGKEEIDFITGEVEAITKLSFSKPTCKAGEKELKLVFSQKANLQVDCYKYQITKDGEFVSGDQGAFFTDFGSKSTFVLCDGMGAGEQAGLESETALGIVEELIKSGFGYEQAMHITNSALMTKNGEESCSTLDIASLDLYTGKIEFYKAGAVASFIKQNKKTIEVVAPSMPIGILSHTNFAKSEAYLKEGDLVVMVSDGVTATGSSWVQSVIDNYQGDKPKELALQIGENARKRNETLHSDDITVMVGFITKGIS